MPRFGLLLCLLATVSSAQWLNRPTAGIPRTADGKPILTAPAPRTADGKPDLSGYWSAQSDLYYNNIVADLKPQDILPWADALSRQRVRDFSKDSMESSCLPMGPAALTGPFRSFKIMQSPSLILILLEDLTYRQIFLDGRKLEENPNPSWMGYSIGHWDGDTLVVESNGYTPRVWLDYDGHPHSEDLRITERFRRVDVGHVELRMKLDDPKAYAKPWTVTIQHNLQVDEEMVEFVCNENEKDGRHMGSKGPQLSDAPISRSLLAQYVGIYDFSGGERRRFVEITESNGSLYWDQDGTGGRQRLLPFSETAFSLSGTVIEFVAEGGRVTHFVMKEAEGDTKAVRRN
jgi:hypothetical protein